MQSALRRLAASRLLTQCEISSSSCGVCVQQLQQQAGYAKKAESVDNKLQRVLKMLEPQEVEDVELSEEDYKEAMQRAKEYSRRKMQQHREWQADLSTKIQLKLAAVAALPPHLRQAAEVPDDEPFPLNRQMWNHTPPIEGYGQATAVTQQAGVKKMGTKHLGQKQR